MSKIIYSVKQLNDLLHSIGALDAGYEVISASSKEGRKFHLSKLGTILTKALTYNELVQFIHGYISAIEMHNDFIGLYNKSKGSSNSL